MLLLSLLTAAAAVFPLLLPLRAAPPSPGCCSVSACTSSTFDITSELCSVAAGPLELLGLLLTAGRTTLAAAAPAADSVVALRRAPLPLLAGAPPGRGDDTGAASACPKQKPQAKQMATTSRACLIFSRWHGGGVSDRGSPRGAAAGDVAGRGRALATPCSLRFIPEQAPAGEPQARERRECTGQPVGCF